MANPHKGEVGFTADGREWVLRYSANALCTLEDALDMSTGEMVARLQDAGGVRMTTLRAVFWAGLQDHHKDVSKERAGELMDEVGYDKAGSLIGQAFARTFPEEEAGKKARPPKGGAAGTGKGS